MRIMIAYDDEFTLSDDALLYQIAEIRNILGCIVPNFTDEGTHCVFELDDCIDALPVVEMLDQYVVTRDQIGLKLAKDALLSASSKLRSEAEKLLLDIPGLRLLPPSSDNCYIGRNICDGQVTLFVFILYGLNNKQQATVLETAQWLSDEAERAAGHLQRIEQERDRDEHNSIEPLYVHVKIPFYRQLWAWLLLLVRGRPKSPDERLA